MSDHYSIIESLRRELVIVTEQLKVTTAERNQFAADAMHWREKSYASYAAANAADWNDSVTEGEEEYHQVRRKRQGTHHYAQEPQEEQRHLSQRTPPETPHPVSPAPLMLDWEAGESALAESGSVFRVSNLFPYHYVPPLEFLPPLFVEQHFDVIAILDQYAQLFHRRHVGCGDPSQVAPSVRVSDVTFLSSQLGLAQEKIRLLEAELENKAQQVMQLTKTVGVLKHRFAADLQSDDEAASLLAANGTDNNNNKGVSPLPMNIHASQRPTAAYPSAAAPIEKGRYSTSDVGAETPPPARTPLPVVDSPLSARRPTSRRRRQSMSPPQQQQNDAPSSSLHPAQRGGGGGRALPVDHAPLRAAPIRQPVVPSILRHPSSSAAAVSSSRTPDASVLQNPSSHAAALSSSFPASGTDRPYHHQPSEQPQPEVSYSKFPTPDPLLLGGGRGGGGGPHGGGSGRLVPPFVVQPRVAAPVTSPWSALFATD